ncbi:hypothetical protein SLS58_010746 [Diplodia intermedia]|uniref:Uncharacterized protein n=1 Tax=Diplodia intermedia TaxID=856260 RepID=A0ABR3T453_9PEZI
MTTFGLISLDNAAATYDPVKHQLRISAEGHAPHGTHGFEFKRMPWLGDLKFELDAWTPRYRVEDRPYTYDESFDIPSLITDVPSGEIIIVSLNHPSGLPVKVRWLGYGGGASIKSIANGNGTQLFKKHHGPEAMHQPPDTDTITALYKEPFNVKEPIPSSGRGFAKVLFDVNALMMVDSSVEDGIITWTLNSLNTGKTQVIVERYAGDGGGLIRKVYNVNVVVLDNVLAQDKSIAQVNVMAQDKAILEFLGRIFIAVRIVRKAVPEAQLLWVQAKLPRGMPHPVTDPSMLSHLDCRFSTPSGSASMRSRGWGDWAPPVFSDHRIIGMNSMDVEKLPMNINDAVDAMRKHHITEPFWGASLKSPSVAPEELPDEPPYYVFHMVNGKDVWVSQTGAICVTDACESVYPKQGL